MSTRLSLLALAAFVTPGGLALGQAAPTAPPQYEVEVIAFAYRDFDPSEERFDQTVEGLPEAAFGLPLAPPVFDESLFGAMAPVSPPAVPPIAPETAPAPTEPLEPVEDPLLVRPLRADELKLGGEYRRVRAISGYVPLLHTGWVQPGLPEDQSEPFDLATIGTLNPRGTVRVHLSRFLHVTLDLTYRDQDVSVASEGTAGLSELALAPRYRLRTTRNVRSGELHYFDHPAFGVLVRVTPRAAPPTQPGQRPAA